MKNTKFLITLAVVALTLPSCNTFVGMGKDFKRLGEGMQNRAYGQTWQGQGEPTYAPPTNTYAPQ